MTGPITFFLAHAGRTTDRAVELRNLLHPEVPVFLDACDLAPGDQWDVKLARSQQEALATVALISADTEAAYYLRDEIASAIAFQRHDPDTHRLIPVFLDGVPADPKQIPYGLRGRHALDASKLGLPGVAAELRKVAAQLTGAPPPTRPPDTPEPADAVAMFDLFCTLLPGQFDEVVFRTGAPRQHLSPPTAPLSQRALDLLQWGEQGGAARMHTLNAALRKVAPAAR